MAISIILFIIGFVLLVKGGDLFLDGAVYFSRKLHIPEMVIGATIVSLGTTLPEFMVSMTAAFSGGTEIAYGNAIGSIICNTGLIGSVAIVFGTFSIRRKQIFKMIAFLAAMLGFTAFCIIGRGEVTRFDGILLFLMLVLYILSCYEKEAYPVQTDVQEDTRTMEGLMMAIGIAAIVYGSHLIVDNVTNIALHLGISRRFIALTVVALGTSLPELVTTITSVVKKHGAIGVGNIIGANIMNLGWVIAGSAAVRPIIIEKNLALLDFGMAFGLTAIMAAALWSKRKISKVIGFLLILVYVAYIVKLN